MQNLLNISFLHLLVQYFNHLYKSIYPLNLYVGESFVNHNTLMKYFGKLTFPLSLPKIMFIFCRLLRPLVYFNHRLNN